MKIKNSVFALAALLLVQPGTGTAVAEDYDAGLSSFTGTVDVLAQGETDSWRAAESEMPLSAGDKVRAGESSSAEITLDGGGVIRLGADSVVDISSLESRSSSFFLRLGSLVAKIQRELLERAERLEVRTPSAVCSVRGTEFGVEHDRESGETVAGVFDEGSLSVASADKDGRTVAEEVVEKGSEVRLRAGARKFKPGAMRRLLRHRKTLEAIRGRLEILRRNWKRSTPEKRRELRKRFLARKAFLGQRAVKQGAARPQQKSGLLEKAKQRAAERRAGREKRKLQDK
ncbi:MAG: FecR domain-containing protein [Elusimicrobia bacterium]|nr:FecR domain-containing protein [Elusimicrobiota bacterium]